MMTIAEVSFIGGQRTSNATAPVLGPRSSPRFSSSATSIVDTTEQTPNGNQFQEPDRVLQSLFNFVSRVGLRSALPSNHDALTHLEQYGSRYRSMNEVLEKITAFSSLPEDWDSYGAVGLSDRARQSALEFVFQLLDSNLLDRSMEMDLLPTPTGGIQFEWSESGGELEIEIDQDGNFHSLIEFANGDYEESSRDRPLSWPQVRNQVKSILH